MTMQILPLASEKPHAKRLMELGIQAMKAVPEALPTAEEAQGRNDHTLRVDAKAVSCMRKDTIDGPHLRPPTSEWGLILSTRLRPVSPCQGIQ